MAANDKAAADKRMADDRAKLKQEREQRTKVADEIRNKQLGTPTPTQEEADLIKMGHHPELAPDGSTDPYAERNLQATEHGGGYQTRQSSPAPAASGHRARSE